MRKVMSHMFPNIQGAWFLLTSAGIEDHTVFTLVTKTFTLVKGCFQIGHGSHLAKQRLIVLVGDRPHFVLTDVSTQVLVP